MIANIVHADTQCCDDSFPRYSGGQLAAGDVYTAGAAIRWLKQLGPWNDADIAQRLIPCYPEVSCCR